MSCLFNGYAYLTLKKLSTISIHLQDLSATQSADGLEAAEGYQGDVAVPTQAAAVIITNHDNEIVQEYKYEIKSLKEENEELKRIIEEQNLKFGDYQKDHDY